MSSGGNLFYYHTDMLGSIANLTDAAGDSQWTYSYEPYGAVKTETQDDPSAPANPIRFTGELQDETGLYHLRARQYDTATGRFLGVDPLAPSVSSPAVSAYSYVSNRPTVLVDPSGLWQQPVDAQAPAAAVSSPGNGFGPVDADCIPSRSQYAGPASLYDVWAAGYVAGCTAVTIIAATAKATIECAQSLRCVATNAILFAAGGGIGRLGLALGERAIAGRVGLGLTGRTSVATGERGVARAGAGGAARGGRLPDDVPASTPVGRRGSPIDVRPGTNAPADIAGRQYSGHALDRMQSRGIPPSAVEDAIANSQPIAGRGGTTIHYSPENHISVVVGPGGRVVTVGYGRFRP